MSKGAVNMLHKGVGRRLDAVERCRMPFLLSKSLPANGARWGETDVMRGLRV